MRILVTGVSGRIGANLAAQLLEQGHAVRGLVWGGDLRAEKLAKLDIERVEGSLTVKEDVKRAMDGVDAVYHLGAAFQGGGPFSPDDYFQINVGGTFNMLEAACAQKQRPQFIFASTDALYDKYVPGGMPEPIDEQTPKRPKGPYALTKSLGEEMCYSYWLSHRLPTTSLRFAMVRAADEIFDFPQFYLSKMKDSGPAFAALWKGQEQLTVLKDADGRPYKKHIADVRDIVHGCLCALGKEQAAGEVFQLAGPRPFAWDEAVPLLAELLELPVVEVQSDGVPTFYEFDISKARRLLGFAPSCTIDRMFEDAHHFRRGQDIGVVPTL